MVRVRANPAASAALLLRAALSCALVLALAGCSQSSGRAAARPRPRHSTYTLLQMNLCLSGLAGCYGKVDYPAGIEEAVTRINTARPGAVTVNEACSGDLALIAQRTAYHLRFSRVIYHGKPLACVHPSGRGRFGDAVLSRTAIEGGESAAFRTQAGPERRQWLCIGTRAGVEVCTAHLASPEADEVAANGPQCVELKALLAYRATARTVIFGGDVNRLPSCAPRGFWTRTDRASEQDGGRQQVYGTGELGSPSAEVLPARHTDHDVLAVRAQLTARP